MEQLIELHGKPKALNSARWCTVDARGLSRFFCTFFTA
jgi:hypothetical protein